MRNAVLLLALAAALVVGAWLLLRDGDDEPRVAPPADGASASDAPTAAGSPGAEPTPPRARAGRPVEGEGPSPALRVITGIVRRASDGKDVAGATVRRYVVDARDVADADGAALVDATPSEREPAAIATTDDEGRFSFEVAEDARWEVVAAAEGFAPASKRGRGAGFADLELEVPSAVRFVVVDRASRAPVAGALIRVHPDDGATVAKASARSDTAGRVEVPLVLADWMLVTAPGYGPKAAGCPTFGEEPYEIEMDPAAVVAGEVVDASGRPVPGARVTIDALAPLALAREIAGADGRFRFAVAAGETVHTLRADAEGHAPAASRARAGDESVRIRLDAAAWIEGTAVDARGAQLDAFDVLRGVDLGGGRFRVGPLEPGLHEVIVEVWRDEIRAQGHALVPVRAGERRTGVRIVVPDRPISEVAVRVLDPEGAPANDVLVHCALGPGRAPSGGVPTVAGTARVTVDVAAGTAVSVHVEPQDGRRDWAAPPPVEARTAAIGASEPVVVRLLPARIVAVRVLDPRGTEIADERRRIFVVGGHGARTTPDGLLVADGARFRLRIWTDGRAEYGADLSSGDVSVGVLTIQLPRRAAVRGRLVLDGELPAAVVRVGAGVSPNGGDHVSASITPTDDGAFSLEGLPDGRGDVTVYAVHADDTRLRRIPITVSGADVDLGDVRIGPFMRLAGEVVDERDLPVAHAHVLVTTADGFRCEAPCGDDGTFVLRVPAGAPAFVFAAKASQFSPLVDVATTSEAPPLRLRLERAVDVLVTAPWAHADDLGVRFGRPGGGAGDPGVPLERIWRSGPPPRFSIRVPPGTWELRFRVGGRELTRTVTLRRGDVGDVTIDE